MLFIQQDISFICKGEAKAINCFAFYFYKSVSHLKVQKVDAKHLRKDLNSSLLQKVARRFIIATIQVGPAIHLRFRENFSIYVLLFGGNFRNLCLFILPFACTLTRFLRLIYRGKRMGS